MKHFCKKSLQAMIHYCECVHLLLKQWGRDPSRPYPLLPVCIFLVISFAALLSACSGQAQQPDPRLKYFQVIDTRIVISGGQAQVYGEIINTSTMKFPFDVSMQANLMDQNGNSVGTASGTAEDVGPGQTRQFLLLGTVDGTQYAKMTVTPNSLMEKRQELGLPTPTPLSQ